jgi:hypothetical protein
MENSVRSLFTAASMLVHMDEAMFGPCLKNKKTCCRSTSTGERSLLIVDKEAAMSFKLEYSLSLRPFFWV